MGELVRGAFAGGAGRWDRDRRLWWLLWASCPGVGWVRLQALGMACGGLEAAWRSPPEQLAAVPGWTPRLVARVEGFRGRWGPEPLEAFALRVRSGRGVLLPGDARWPEAMHRLQPPPLALHWQGQGRLWSPLARRRAVAVVGTRRPSLHGLTMARRLGAALAAAGWPVVSGLAEGIDGAAHEGCLERGGVPVGVLGTPLERVYPRHHAQLQRRVGRHGLLLSEHPRGAPVTAGHFARRNRLQVGLAAAVVVVECPPASGALHSAELAWKQELPLWVVPADAGRASAAGSNRLLARGATPLLHPADLLDQIGAGPLQVPACQAPRAPDSGSDPARLLAAVGGGATLEQISRSMGRPPHEVATRLLELELAGRLRSEAGLLWRPWGEGLPSLER
ncbi:MAG: DNA-processing protein DprA [Synechococcaceae cyanobacterium]|nr:DNA-processing protein DprA [Synechococcaceae cyanobacterium]